MLTSASFTACQLAVAAILLGVSFAHVAQGCSVAYNSTKPVGYFDFPWYFPSSSTPRFKGDVTNAGGADGVSSRCARNCSASSYGFYIRFVAPFLTTANCYCITGPLDYSQPIGVYGYTMSKECPTIKPKPPPLKAPPPPARPPPPPYRPPQCKVAYNSSDPFGYFQFSITSYRAMVPVFSASLSKKKDVWPLQGALARCSKYCANHPNGFVLKANEYQTIQDCYCVKKPVNYSILVSSDYYVSNFYLRTCPSKK